MPNVKFLKSMLDEKPHRTAKHVETYLDKILAIRPTLRKWKEEKSLPIFLRELYEFYTGELLSKFILFAIRRGDSDQSVSSIEKHIGKIQEKWPGLVAYVTEEIAAPARNKLIEKRIPFLVPENQLFLPMIGIDLRERFKASKPGKPEFSPATQVLILDSLYSPGEPMYSVSDSAKRLDYSAMTISRAFDELERAKIGVHKTRGRTREVVFPGSKRKIWEDASPYLKSPVQKTVHVMKPIAGGEFAIAGLSALSHFSNLAEPEIRTIGMDGKTWLKLKAEASHITTRSPEPDWTAIEIWAYSPSRYGRRGVADPLSVYLSLRNLQDERVQQALEELLEGLGW
jgi:DNA-binding transcriptional regulator YhcF (GntR family)